MYNCTLPSTAMLFLAHVWVLATDVVRIDLERSISILSYALPFTSMFIAHKWALATCTCVVRIYLK